MLASTSRLVSRARARAIRFISSSSTRRARADLEQNLLEQIRSKICSSRKNCIITMSVPHKVGVTVIAMNAISLQYTLKYCYFKTMKNLYKFIFDFYLAPVIEQNFSSSSSCSSRIFQPRARARSEFARARASTSINSRIVSSTSSSTSRFCSSTSEHEHGNSARAAL